MQRAQRVPAALGVVITLLLSAGCSFDKDEPPKSNATAEITTDASTHTLENITISVVPNTVNAPTKLSVSPPMQQLSGASRPFGDLTGTSVQFDISLAGQAQPLQPLDVKIPLSGNFLPAGAKPEHALLYSPNEAGQWRLVPSVVENETLTAKVASLSPKHIVFFDPLEDFWQKIGQWQPEGVKDCNREITTSETGKIKLGGSGWKTSTDSPVHPCLVEENGKAMLRVSNNSSIMWSVASSGPSINTPGAEVEAEFVKLIVKKFNADERIKAYLAEGDATWTPIDSNSLPTTLQFRANPDTFLARAFWVALNMAVGMFTGTSGDQTAAFIKTMLVDGSDLMGCIGDAAQSANNILDANKVIDTLLSVCGEKIAQAVGVDVVSKGAAEWTLGGVLAALGGIKDSVGLLGTAFDSVLQQVKGDITVTVERAAPPCATPADFKRALRNNDRGTVVSVTRIKCSNGWAEGGVSFNEAYSGADGGRLIRFVDGEWTFVHTLHEPLFYGTESGDRICPQLPADFRQALCVRI